MKYAAFGSLAVAGFLIVSLSSIGLVSSQAAAADKEPTQIPLAEGKFTLKAPEEWEKREPRTRIVEFEMAVPAAEGDKEEGRMTVMGAGGSVEQNIDRWIGQFTQADGKPTKERANIDKKKIAGQQGHVVDITGDFKDQAGPFAPAVLREQYRMLAAIITTEKSGQYFIKLTGPKRTVAAAEKAFHEMLDSLTAK
jgi:hypothetical protein